MATSDPSGTFLGALTGSLTATSEDEDFPVKWSDAYPFTEMGPHDSDLEEVTFPAFAPILSDAFEHFTDLPEPSEISPGTLLLEQGELCKTVWLIRDGLVRLTYVSHDGRETTLGLRAAGWFAGAACLIMNTPNVCSVKAVTPCIVSRIPAQDFSRRLAQSARLMRHFTSALCLELIAQTTAQVSLMSDSAEQRLDGFMRERSARHPQIKTLDALPLLKQMELAQLLSITPEHLSRLLRRTNKNSHPNLEDQHDDRR
jgi:CRP-like cAMP-binding protein